MENISIQINHVTKSFKKYGDKGQTLKEKLLFRERSRYQRTLALEDISFTIPKGEVVAIIGKNGSGKSTLLKLLTRIMYPDSGTIEVYGKVSSIIELGAGFHPDLTGLENVYTNASIYGLRRTQIDEKLKQIIDFSELRDFIGSPVRTYSNGMYARLAFSVCINIPAEILLVDEILSVGDNNFQKKCFDQIRKMKAEGTTIVIVTHAINSLNGLCDRVLWVKDHHIFMDGSPNMVVPQYLNGN